MNARDRLRAIAELREMRHVRRVIGAAKATGSNTVTFGGTPGTVCTRLSVVFAAGGKTGLSIQRSDSIPVNRSSWSVSW